jgi:putative hydrolase of the HAD superfamily
LAEINSRGMNMKKLYIFDMGGVVSTDGNVFARISEYLNISGEEFISLAGESEVELSEGRITAEEFWQRFSRVSGKEIKEELFGKFFDPRLNKGTVAIIEKLKKESRVVCGTNTIEPHYLERVEHGDYELFDELYASHLMGVAKPKAAFFEYILRKEQIEAREVVFIDDDPENVEGAAVLGLEAILFRGAASLKKEIGWLKGLTGRLLDYIIR